MSKSHYLLKQHTLNDLFTIVYVLVDDYLKAAEAGGHLELPCSEQQKGSYSELMTIALVGDLLNQADTGLWFSVVKSIYGSIKATRAAARRGLRRTWAGASRW